MSLCSNGLEILFSSFNHRPRSTRRHLFEQNGPFTAANQFPKLRQVGHGRTGSFLDDFMAYSCLRAGPQDGVSIQPPLEEFQDWSRTAGRRTGTNSASGPASGRRFVKFPVRRLGNCLGSMYIS
jgi:hypothetical protein